MNALNWCRFVLCAFAIAASAWIDVAQAQRVRFGTMDADAAGDGWVSTASRYVSTSGSRVVSGEGAEEPAPASGESASGESAPSPRYSTPNTPVYVASTPITSTASSTSVAPIDSDLPSPAGGPIDESAPDVAAGSAASPAAAYGASVSPPRLVASAWDPYQVATRRAAFAGTVTSTPGLPGQFTLPQPMPRVPYYTQQPAAISGQPYVVLPEPGRETPVTPMQVAPTSAPFSVPTLTAPPPITAPPPTVPTLTAPLGTPLATSRNCYAHADAIFFTRDARFGNTPLVLLDMPAPTQSNVLLSTADIDFDFEPGPRVLLGTQFDGFRAFEASYFGIYNWDYTATITGDNNLNLPGDLGLAAPLNFFNADQMVVTYNTDVHNGELNYLQYYGNLAWLVGFRYFNLSEKFGITSTVNQTGSSFYNVSAYNNLFGAQLGGRVKQECGRWSYDLTGKAGLYGNAIRSSQRVSDFDGFTARDTQNSGGQAAFLGELALSGYYRFSECLSLRGGYQVYWIEGVALAPDQLDFTDTPTSGTNLNKTGGLFMHGAHAGLMAQW